MSKNIGIAGHGVERERVIKIGGGGEKIKRKREKERAWHKKTNL